MGVAVSPRKTVAIRGLDVDLYNEVFSMAKRNGKRVADVVNVALETFLDGADDNPGVKENSSLSNDGQFVLRNNGEIRLSKRDIVGLKREVGPFLIENTGHIIFEKDVTKEALKNIDNIVIHTGTVEVPSSLYPHFLVRSDIHGKLEKY